MTIQLLCAFMIAFLFVTAFGKWYIPWLEKEKARIEKELANAAKQLQAQIGKLSNQNFVTRAPEAVVNVEREKKAKLEALIENLKLSLEHLGK